MLAFSPKKMASSQLISPSISESLYCVEERWDRNGEEVELDPENCCSEGETDSFSSDCSLNPKRFLELTEKNLWEDEELSSLLFKEREYVICNAFGENPFAAKARGEAVEWVVKAVGFFSFSVRTAVLAVNYLDRFLCSFQHQSGKPWMAQLVAVACLSLASKVEEIQVPLLIDLQVESKFAFESKTIQRMEILVLSTLKWKMHPTTPCSLLEYIACRLRFDSHLTKQFLTRCELLLLSILYDCRFMCYFPSELATATLLYVITSFESSIAVQYRDQLASILGANKAKVEDCCKLIEDASTDTRFYSSNKRKFGSLPGSPKGVIDVSFSSESSNGTRADGAMASVSSSPEPLSKKLKSQRSNDPDMYEVF